jgi:hypothetical protein
MACRAIREAARPREAADGTGVPSLGGMGDMCATLLARTWHAYGTLLFMDYTRTIRRYSREGRP